MSFQQNIIDLRNELRNTGMDMEQIRQYIRSYLSEEAEDLKNEFLQEFKNVNNENAEKSMIMEILGELGIYIYSKPELEKKESIETL